MRLRTVFELHKTGQAWAETVLHRFGIRGRDGANPYYGMNADAKGNFYSTATAGGGSGQGIVFEFHP